MKQYVVNVLLKNILLWIVHIFKIDIPLDTEVINYSNGAQSIMVNGKYIFIRYDNGDQVWFSFRDDGYAVQMIHTHNNIIRQYNE